MRPAALLITLLAAGCSNASSVPAVSLPPGLFGIGVIDQDVSAINTAAYDFSSPANTANPAEAARAVAAYEYITVALTAPRWACMPPTVMQQLAAGRIALRRALAIAATAPPQDVISRMAYAFFTLAHGDRAAALTAFASPVFDASPAETLERLQHLPRLQEANVGSMAAGAVVDGAYSSGCADAD